jgi:hypothetical protein
MKTFNYTVKTIFYYIALLGMITISVCQGKNSKKGLKGQEKVKQEASVLDKKAHKHLESFSVAVVGKQVITDQDVKRRLAMEAVFLRRSITPKNYVKMYTDAALALVNEARQSQAPTLLLAMAKKSLQTQSVSALLPEEIKKELDDRILAMAKGNAMTLDEFRSYLGPHYDPFCERQEAMITFQRFVMLKWGSRAMRNIADNAIAKARKKRQAKQKSVQYRVGEIVVYNRRNDGSDYQKILEIQRLLQGGDVVFSEMAYQESDAKTNENGGDCGWNVLEYFDRPVQDFLRTASIGDISPIIALPTARNPEKWVVVLYKDQRHPKTNQSDEDTKDPGDDFFRNILFGTELERLSKIEMEELKKSYPSTLYIPKNLTMPSDFNVMIRSDESGDSEPEKPAEGTEAAERETAQEQSTEDELNALASVDTEDQADSGNEEAETGEGVDDGIHNETEAGDETVEEENAADTFGQTPLSLGQNQANLGPFGGGGGLRL